MKKAASSKVILVEDDRLLAQMYQLRLQTAGYAVQIAGEADELWELTKTAVPAVIVLDILLPKVNGLRILKDLRAHKRLQSVPVIILTNLHRVEIELTPELGELLGVVAYLVKSQTTPDEVVEWVRRAIEHST